MAWQYSNFYGESLLIHGVSEDLKIFVNGKDVWFDSFWVGRVPADENRWNQQKHSTQHHMNLPIRIS